MLIPFILIEFFWVCCLVSHAEQTQAEDYQDCRPKNCNTNPGEILDSYKTVEDFERCAPYLLPDYARLYFQGAAGRQVTIKENKKAFASIRILPKILRDVSNIDLSVTVLGDKISMPILFDPVAFQKLASDLGEIDTVRAAAKAGTIMAVSSLSNTLIEDLAEAAPGTPKWMQTYIFPDRSQTLNLIRRAEASGFKAIVVTVDSPIAGTLPNNARNIYPTNPKNATTVNLFVDEIDDSSITFRDLAWLTRQTKLPVVAKGILTPVDAVRAVQYGVDAILVSNHGGRQLDFVPATIDVLEGIVDALRRRYPKVQVYLDGGVRNGFDVFKALALGARAVLIGRPLLWGLAAGGEAGVDKVLNILRTELNETMMLAGTPTVRDIERGMVVEAPCRTYYHSKRYDPYEAMDAQYSE